MQKIKGVIKERKFKFISFFWLLISIQFVVGGNLQTRGYSIGSFKENVISIIEIIVLSIIFIVLHYCFLILYNSYKNSRTKNDKIKEIPKENKLKKYSGIIYFLIIFVCWIPAILAFYPSILNYDGPIQIFKFTRNEMNAGYSFPSTFLLGGFYKMGFNINNIDLGMFLYTIFQSTVMASIFSYTVNFVKEKTNNKVYTFIVLAFYAIFPYNQLFPLITTKDTLFAGIMLLFMIKLYKIMTEENTIEDYIIVIIIGILTALFRSNCICAFVVMVPCIFFILIKNRELCKKLLVIFILTIVGYNVINNLLVNLTHAENISGQIGTTIFSQAVGKVCQEKQEYLTDEEKEKIDYYYGSYEKLAKMYRGNISDYTNTLIQYENVQNNKKEFFEFVIDLGLKYPRIYIDSFLDTTRGYWYINDDSFCNVWGDDEDKGCLELAFNGVFKEEHLAVQQHSYLPELQNLYKDLFAKNYYRNIPILYIVFQPSFYFYILIACILYSIYKKERKMLILQILLLMYFATCFFGPCAIIRYIYAVIVSVPIIALSVFKDTKKEKI